MALTPEEHSELKRLLLKATGREGDPVSELDPEIRFWDGKGHVPEGALIVVMPPASQPQQGSAKVHGDKIE